MRAWSSLRSRSPFKCRGWRFSIRAQAAILADEMGLGKTMQAITAMRLLVRAGEIATVLLVCPKPLVTNWQREFPHGRRSCPLLVVEGDRAAGIGSGNWPMTPIKMANYESCTATATS